MGARLKTTQISDERILSSDIFEGGRDAPARRGQGVYREPARSVPVYHHCDVLVVGGGPAGTAAAAAAAREGADVCLLERYNHLGGLSTGGLVIWIDRMSDWEGRPTIRGFAEEIIDRLPRDAIAGPPPEEWGSRDPTRAAYWALRTAAYHGIVTWSPTLDPEWLKLQSQEMLLERRVRLVYHSWASTPIVEDGAVRGAVFESKEGRQAIFAKVVIDATGDGDMFARAGARAETDVEEDDIHHCINTAFMFAGVDMTRFLEFRAGRPEQFSDFMKRGRESCGLFERAFVSWRNDVALFMGPRQSGYSGLDVDDLSTVEVRSHRAMKNMLEFYRQNAPGFENAYMMLSAPQIGVRHTRRLSGVSAVTRRQWPTSMVHPDEVGVTPSVSPKFPNISVPYASLIPETLDGLLAPGRHVACDRNSHGFMREIPQCWLTGQAAGVAAAVAISQGVTPRHVDIARVQSALRNQGVYLRTAAEAKAAGLPTELAPAVSAAAAA